MADNQDAFQAFEALQAPSEPEAPEPPPTPKAAVYIDGFNLYHSILEMDEPFLKWCNLWSLSERLCSHNKHELVKVTFCTAMPEHRPGSFGRHQTYNSALTAQNVKIVKGHFVFNDEINRHSEKQSDINVALELIVDAMEGVYDWAYLVSADSDQAATARVLKSKFPGKMLALAAPPNRRPPEKAVPYGDLAFTIKKEDIEACLLPQYVQGSKGMIRRPPEYDPPDWWLPPGQRPKRKR